MVDAGNALPAAFQLVLHAQFLQQEFRAHLDAVAQAHGFDARVPLHVAGEHGHRVGVVEEKGIRADFLHIPGEVVHDGNGAQGTHDTANPQGIADGLAQTVLLGYLEVDDGAGVIEAHLDGVDYESGPPEGFLPIFNSQIGGDLPVSALGPVHGGDDLKALLQADGIDVVQSEFPVPEGLGTHAVSQHIADKHGAARAHKSDLIHIASSCL